MCGRLNPTENTFVGICVVNPAAVLGMCGRFAPLAMYVKARWDLECSGGVV